MSKSVSRLKALKSATVKIEHSQWMMTNIPAGMATAGPPLGSMLGQRNINIATFCKDFNERTAEVKKGIPIPVRVAVNPDRSYTLIMHQPPVTYFLKQAAGIESAAMFSSREIAGKITRKHLFEIAKIKSQDPPLQHKSLQEICNSIVGTARTCGIQIVDKLDKEEYAQFLEERRAIVEEQKKELMERKEAKMLRTA
ncbi:mitochondrial ribosomal protein L11 [Arctopsyche grandis]|uniref:mitochondrial ribosomal protein L11 n=1 Tax=Arctopsyche grandis TaxID=121162 RepID=UPI00406D82E4